VLFIQPIAEKDGKTRKAERPDNGNVRYKAYDKACREQAKDMISGIFYSRISLDTSETVAAMYFAPALISSASSPSP
jgi:hypothetical protein